MIRVGAICWWLVFVAGFPVLLFQALWVHRYALRLPVAEGDDRGVANNQATQTPIRLLVLGESTVAGVGVGRCEHALPARLAERLARQWRTRVTWQARGETGLRARQTSLWLVDEPGEMPWDLVVLVFGVNDVTALTSLKQWQCAMAALIDHFHSRAAQVICTAVPPMQNLTVLPQFLRHMLGWRASLLAHSLQTLCRCHDAVYCPLPSFMPPDCLAEDGYHPSKNGYEAWADHLAAQIMEKRSPAPSFILFAVRLSCCGCPGAKSSDAVFIGAQNFQVIGADAKTDGIFRNLFELFCHQAVQRFGTVAR